MLQCVCRLSQDHLCLTVLLYMFVNVLLSLCVLSLTALKEHWLSTPQWVVVKVTFSLPLLCLSTGPQVIFTVFILLWLWLVPIPVPIFILQLLFQPLFQTQLVLRKPVQVRPSLLSS